VFFRQRNRRTTADFPRFADLPVDKLWVEIAAGIILSETHSEREVIAAMRTREIRRTALLQERRL
jgi:hypothetical protein